MVVVAVVVVVVLVLFPGFLLKGVWLREEAMLKKKLEGGWGDSAGGHGNARPAPSAFSTSGNRRATMKLQM